MATWNWNKSSFSTTARKSTKSKKSVATGYQQVVKGFNQRIQSYKTLCSQATGPAKQGRPSATSLNSMSKWIEKGAIIKQVSPAQVKRWTKAPTQVKSATTAKNALCRKFGRTTIKAVTNGKNGFLVACAPKTPTGKAFNFPR